MVPWKKSVIAIVLNMKFNIGDKQKETCLHVT